jgi:hypothetical protein
MGCGVLFCAVLRLGCTAGAGPLLFAVGGLMSLDSVESGVALSGVVCAPDKILCNYWW